MSSKVSSTSSGGGGGSGGSKTSHKKKDEKRPTEGRKYAQIPKESVALYAETVVERIGDEISKPLAEDISYRLREVIHGCSTYLSQANRNYLTTEDINQVLENMDVQPIFGHSGGGSVNFSFVREASLFTEEDPEVDVVQLALSNTSISQKGNHFIKSMWLLPKKSSEEVQEPGPSSGGMSSTECENKIALPVTLINYYKHAFRVIGGYSKLLFEILGKDFRTNIKLGPVLPYIVENIATAIQEADRNGQRIIWLLNITDSLACNKAVDLSPSLSVNKLISSLLYCSIDIKVRNGNYISADDDLRQKAAFILSKVLRRWCGSVVVREVLRKVSAILEDFNTPLQVHRGALHVLTTMGEASLALCLWPLLIPPGNYIKFLDVIQTVPEVMVDYEAMKNIILTAAESLHQMENIKDEDGDFSSFGIPKKRTSADIEKDELAVDIQQILYQQFGDTVCCRWRLLYPAISKTRNKTRLNDICQVRSYPIPRPYTPKQKSSNETNGETSTLTQMFELTGPRFPPVKQSTSTNDSTDSIFNIDNSSLIQLQCKSRNKPLDSHKIFNPNTSFPKTNTNIYWTGKMHKSRFLAFQLCGNLQTAL